MSAFSRRRLLQAGAVAPIAARLAHLHRPEPAPREKLLLDFGWRFHLGHANDLTKDFGYGHAGNQASEFGKSGELFRPARLNFDDSGWDPINVPHDWAIGLPFVEADELNDFGHYPLGRNYPETSIGWYRKVFAIPASDAGRRISLEFDGIFRDAVIALNGHLVGRNFSGYAPYRADVSDIVTYGGRNTLVVRVDATEHEGWFYEGAGIYRHAWLVKTAPLHVAHWGTFVTTQVAGAVATVTVATEIENESDTAASCMVAQTIRDTAGRTIAVTHSVPVRVAPWERSTVTQRLTVAKPALWSVEHPTLHVVETSLEGPTGTIDRYQTTFGIRTMRFDPNEGFLLNGERVELKGTCNHQDHAGVGSALPDALQEYRIRCLKAMGSNAYRTSHNPPTPELLDACDRLGMLVLDENRTFSSEDEGAGQLARLIRRDRNHPCVFAWSLANEEDSDQGNDRGARMASTLKRLAHRLDPTRPVTAAMNGGWGKGFTPIVDVQGFNYSNNGIDAIHAAFPAKPLMGTEVASTVGTRGIYANDKARGYLSAYDANKPGWGALAEEWWTHYAARRFLAGGFVWTGFDYRGEPTPYRWPCINSHFGIMDTCGFPKDNFYYYRAWWGNTPSIYLFPHWNWEGKDGELIDVWVHTNAERVTLFLNGANLGVKPVPRNSHLSWKVPYAAGTLEARGHFSDGQERVFVQQTTGPATAIRLRPSHPQLNANAEDLTVIEVALIDAQGRFVATANNPIEFSVSGPGRVIGVGNGDPSCHEPDTGTRRSAFNGYCCAIVQATRVAGEIRFSAASTGLATASLAIGATAAAPRPFVE